MEDKMHIQRVLKYKVLIPRDTRVFVHTRAVESHRGLDIEWWSTLPDPPWVVEPAAWPVFGLVISCPALFFLWMYAMVIIKDKPLIAKIICPMIWRFFIFRSDLSLSSLQHQSSSGPKKDFSEFATMVKIKPTSKSIMVEGRDRRANFLQKSGPLHSPDGLLYLWSKTTPGKARFCRFISRQQTV